MLYVSYYLSSFRSRFLIRLNDKTVPKRQRRTPLPTDRQLTQRNPELSFENKHEKYINCISICFIVDATYFVRAHKFITDVLLPVQIEYANRKSCKRPVYYRRQEKCDFPKLFYVELKGYSA